jgi:hypothetical protein
MRPTDYVDLRDLAERSDFNATNGRIELRQRDRAVDALVSVRLP